MVKPTDHLDIEDRVPTQPRPIAPTKEATTSHYLLTTDLATTIALREILRCKQK